MNAPSKLITKPAGKVEEWKLVPIAAHLAQLLAGQAADENGHHVLAIYDAMVAAAPSRLVAVDCPLCDQTSRFTCEECEGCGKINVTPSATALKNTSTWRERIGKAADFPMHMPTDVERAMMGEIAELRAVAGQAPTSAAPGDPLDMKLPCDVKIGAMTIRAGVALRTLVLKAQRLHKMLMPYLPKPDASQLDEFCRITGQDVRDLRQQYKEMPTLPESRYNGCGDGSEPLYTPEHMWDYAVAYAAKLANTTAPGDETVIGAGNPESFFAEFCEVRGYPSDGEMDAALRGSFYEGIRYCAVQPKSAAPTAQQSLKAVPEGYVMVPVVAKTVMLKAGGHANSEWLNDNAPIGEAHYATPMQSIWAAMLAAALEPGQSTEAIEDRSHWFKQWDPDADQQAVKPAGA